MDESTSVLERAFELAKSGKYPSVEDIGRRLLAEGYSIEQVTGRQLKVQLRALIRTARGGGLPKVPGDRKRGAGGHGNAAKMAKIATGQEAEDS
jgi:hypothetical protein